MEMWGVFLNGRVLNGSISLQHLVSGLAILTFADKDVSAEFGETHFPDVIEKYASDAVIGGVGGGRAKKVQRGFEACLVLCPR